LKCSSTAVFEGEKSKKDLNNISYCEVLLWSNNQFCSPDSKRSVPGLLYMLNYCSVLIHLE